MTFLAFTALALTLGVVCTWALLGAERATWALVVFALLGALGTVTVTHRNPTPVRDLTVLHEGGTARTLAAFYGLDEHVGWLWRDAARSPIQRHGELPIAALLRFNVTLAALSAAALTVLAALATKRRLAGPIALLLLASSRGFWNAALSETPAPALWFAMLSAVPAWGLLHDAEARPWTQRLLALASLAVSGSLAAGLRREFVIYAAPFILLALASLALGTARVTAVWARLRRAFIRVLHAPWPLRLALGLGLLALTGLGTRMEFHARVGLAMLTPTLALQAPAALLGVTPAPVVVLAGFGAVHLVRRGAAQALFSIATTALLGVYLVASHGVGWEMLRYGSMGAMGIWLAAVAGWCALEDLAIANAWHPSWRASLSMVPLFFLPHPGMVDPSEPGWWDADARTRSKPLLRLIDQSAQREARMIARALMETPDCVFIARARQRGDPHGAMELLTFNTYTEPHVAAPGATVRSLREGALGCVRYVRTLDCNLRDGATAPCADDLRDAIAETEVRERAALYSDPKEYGVLAPEVRYGIWRVEP